MKIKKSTLSLLVLFGAANNANDVFALNYFALGADGLDG